MTHLICFSPKFFATGGAREHFTSTVLFLLVPCQISFHFERLFTLIAVECGVKWEVSVDALCVRFQVSLKKEGLFTLSTIPLLLVGGGMGLCKVSLQLFHSFEFLAALGAIPLFFWFLEWVLGSYLMDLALVSFKIL